jgi:hypothetical protein
VDSRLSERELLVLKWVQANEGTMTHVTLGEIADVIHLTAIQVDTEFERLHSDGLVDAKVRRTLNGGNAAGWRVLAPRLTGAGVRALREGPDGLALIAVVERMAEVEPDPTKRSALLRLASAAREVGATVLSEILTTPA